MKRSELETDFKTNQAHLPKMTLATIMKCARHAAVCNAATYMRDSLTLYEWVKQAEMSTDHDVGYFRDCHIEESQPFKSVLGDEC